MVLEIFGVVSIQIACVGWGTYPDGLLQPEKQASPPAGNRHQETLPARWSGTLRPELLWSCAGHWSCLAVDHSSNSIYAVERGRNKLCRLDQDGNILDARDMKLTPLDDTRMLLAQVKGDAAPEILVYGQWGRALRAFTTDGDMIWEFATPTGINNVCACDLVPDEGGAKRDEIVIGLNGDGGVVLLDSAGVKKWSTELSNVWSVQCVSATDKIAASILATSGGAVHSIDKDGALVRETALAGHVTLLRVGRVSTGEMGVAVLDNGASLEGITTRCAELWKRPMDAKDAPLVVDGVFSATGGLFAVALRNGESIVVDAVTGKPACRIPGTSRANLSWLAGKGGEDPRLALGTSEALQVFVLRRVE